MKRKKSRPDPAHPKGWTQLLQVIVEATEAMVFEELAVLYRKSRQGAA